MTDVKPPAARPCGSCPYRRDVSAGLWHPEEYAKLEAYDQDTGSQPPGVFLCHQQDGRMCAGWVGVHGYELLALRIWAHDQSPETIDEVLDYETDVALFSTGQEAAEHGLSGVEAPNEKAQRQIDRLAAKRASREE